MPKDMLRKKYSGIQSLLLIEPLESRQLLSGSATEIVSPSLTIDAAAKSSASTIAGYTPAEIEAAYGISSIKFDGVTGDGAGQTIAIIDAYSDPDIASDLAVFDKEFGLSAAPSFTQESAKGSTTKLPAEDADWDTEISLDVEWAHAIAPDAKIVLVDASSDSMASLMAAVEYARTITSVSVISMSWGGSEFSGETAYDQYFTTPSGHIGITFVAASGDDGASGGVDYPAASPNVVSVGGTTLSLSSTDTITSETAWDDSEGGVSSYESTPSYQDGISSSGRSTPDVSYDADPDTGFAVYDSVSDDGYVGWQEVGGTSAGTPQWSALIAIADQGRVKNGLSTLTTTQTLDELYGIYDNSTDYAADFNDITSGSSVLSEGGGGGGYGDGFGGPFGGGPFGGRFGGRGQTTYVSATTGYDTLTGIGTPKAALLIEAIADAKVTASTASVTKTTADAKTVKTAKFVPSIEFERVASVFGVQVAQSSQLVPLARDQENIELEAATGSTAAATIESPRYPGMAAASAGGQAFLIDDARPMAAPSASAVNSLVSQASASASKAITGAVIDATKLGTDATVALENAVAVPSLFSEVQVERAFCGTLDELAALAATKPAPVVARRQSTASNMLIGGAVAVAEAVWIGYWYANRKKTADGEAVFSDQPMT
jgi:hypothetical protein